MTDITTKLTELGVGSDLAEAIGRPAFRLELGNGAAIEPDGEAEVAQGAEGIDVRVPYRSAAGDTIALRLTLGAGARVARQWLEVTPAETVDITGVAPAVIDAAPFRHVHTVSGVQQQGGYRQDHGPYRSFRLGTAGLDVPFRTESGQRSTWYETPWAALSAGDAGIVAMFAYGGKWAFDVRDGQAAYAPLEIVPRVAAGETWVSPQVWIGAYTGDTDAAAALTHDFVRQSVMPATPDDFPWVQYNTWFSYYCELDETILLQEADIAASLGVEVFYVDAGWWVGNPRRRDRFSSGLGNWRENLEKFPHGLRWFADQIRARGMHFGIWVEPERVDMRTVHTGTWRSDWIADDGGTYIRCPWPSDTDTAWLCFGHPETQAWALEWISDLVGSLGVRWLKWDSNYWGVCTNPAHGHGAGDGEVAQLEGVYTVMAGLRERFPDLIIENCAGGGTRMDYKLAEQTHAAWLNDASEPHYRTRFHSAGASYYYPPEMLNSWITESEHENVNGQELPDEVWRAIIRSRMIGAIGFSNRLVTWSERTTAIAAEEIAFYKEAIRPLLKQSRIHHLLPQPVIDSKELPSPDAWEAYQVAAGDGSSSVILAFRNVAVAPDLTVTPKGLAAETTYRVTIGTAEYEVSGGELAATGIQVVCDLLASVVVRIEAVK